MNPTGAGGPARTIGLALAALAALLALRLGLMLASGSGLHVDEAQYWVWSKALDWGYYSKPPVIAALIAAGTALGGDGIVWIRLPAMLCWLGATALIGWLGARMAGPAAGWWSAALLAATPAAGLLGLVATTDGPLMLGWTAAMVFTWQAMAATGSAGAWRHWTLAGLSLGFALMSKYTAAALPLTWALLAALAAAGTRVAWLRGRVPGGHAGWAVILRGAVWASLVGLLCLAPNLGWNASHGWPTLQHTLEITVQSHSRAGDTAADLLLHLAGQLLQVGPGLLALALLAGWRLVRGDRAGQRPAPSGSDALRAPRDRTPLIVWALCWSLPLHGLALLQAFRSGTQINWTAPALVGLCLAGGIWVASAPRRPQRVVAVAAAAGALLFAAIAADAPRRLVTALRGEPPGVQLDAWHKTRGWAEILSPWQPQVAASGLPVAIDERDVFVHAAYVWRLSAPPLRAWRPGGPIRHQFDLVAPFEAPLPPAFWWLGRTDPPPALAPTHRRTLQAQGEHGRLRLKLWLLDNRQQPVVNPASPSAAIQSSRP